MSDGRDKHEIIKKGKAETFCWIIIICLCKCTESRYLQYQSRNL